MQILFLQNWRKNILDKYKIKIYPRAVRELDSIYEYIAVEKLTPEYAKAQTDRIKQAILNLSTFPQSHQERSEGRYAGKGYRQLLIDNYLAGGAVLYTVRKTNTGIDKRQNHPFPRKGKRCPLCRKNTGTF